MQGAGPAFHVEPGKDVLDHGRVHEQKSLLEGSGDALLGDPVRLEPCNIFPVEADGPTGYGESAGDQVEYRWFSCAVRADKMSRPRPLDATLTHIVEQRDAFRTKSNRDSYKLNVAGGFDSG